MRFLLSPPEETMEARPRANPRKQREVLPIAPKEEEAKFGSANSWGRKELKMLGVDIYRQKRVDLNRVLGVRECEWSPELRARTSLFKP